jgi:hypothetical protein
MGKATYEDPNYKKMDLYSPRATEYFKHAEYWIEKLSPCELAFLFVNTAIMRVTNEVPLKLWHTEQDQPDWEHQWILEHYIGIPSLGLLFSFDMEISAIEEKEDGDTYIEVTEVEVEEKSFMINTPEDDQQGPFDIEKKDFTREIPEISWKDFCAMVELLAIDEYNQISPSLAKYRKSLENSLETPPFKSTALFKKIAAMDVDKKIINIGKAKTIGLL